MSSKFELAGAEYYMGSSKFELGCRRKLPLGFKILTSTQAIQEYGADGSMPRTRFSGCTVSIAKRGRGGLFAEIGCNGIVSDDG